MIRAEGASKPAPSRADRGEEFLRALDLETETIDDPVAKLRQLRGSVARYNRANAVLRLVPIPGLRLVAHRVLGLEGIDELMPPKQVVAGVHRRSRAWSFALLVSLAAAGAFVAQRFRAAPVTSAVPQAPQAAAAVSGRAPIAEDLPPTPPAVEPRSVWLVEHGPSFEQYSNGLRVETTFATAGDPRRYRIFTRSGMSSSVFTRPVGILYHTSESDIWPLEASYNENLRKSSHNLLRYIARNKLYNFLIDRFGRVYRIVSEESKANHAGNSVWSHGEFTFLNLNNAFLGICFETRWEGGRALPITIAQLASGRALTDHLRLRYEIAPEMCVTHGLTSVNAKKHLIGHHVDWARGFPFAAFGLPNQYEVAAPAVAEFGFAYDEEFLKKMDGEPWAGVREAERLLGEEAVREGASLDGVRGRKRAVYDRWVEEQIQADDRKAAEKTAKNPQSKAASGG